MKNFNYKLINPCGNEKEDYIKIHQELFPSAAIDNDWIEWYHEKVRASDLRLNFTRTYGLYDSNRLIGIWSVEPKIMRNSNNEIIKVGRCFAVGISSEYRKMGLFVSLSEYAIKSERERAEFEYIIGFPQTGRAVIGGHLKAGWEEIAFNDIYSIDLRFIDGSFFRKDVNTVIDFSQIPNSLSPINSFDEPSSYRNIRYLMHPKLQYTIYTYGDAYIILKPYSTFCHILDIQGSRNNAMILIEACKSVCKRHGLEELNIWNNHMFQFYDELKNCGFSIGAKHGLPITIIAIRINANKRLLIEKELNFVMGVEEGY